MYKGFVSSSPPVAFRMSKKMPVSVQLSTGGKATRVTA
jgi:hypothetical protein